MSAAIAANVALIVGGLIYQGWRSMKCSIGLDAAAAGVIRISRISAAISAALGEVAHLLVAPSADITLPAGTIAVLGTVTWV